MRAAVYRGQGSVGVETVPVPHLQPGELLVRVAACGVCGTDLKKIRYGLVDPPRIFGHETAGEIVEIGEGATAWAVGERVALNHHVPCERVECHYCSRGAYAQCPVYKKTGCTAGFEPSGGGFAEYVRVLAWCVNRGCVRIPAHVTMEEATFVEPLNTCLKGVRLAGIVPGDTVVILGQGPIGLLFTRLAVLAGANVIGSDLYAGRRRLASAWGAAATHDAETGEGELRREVMALSERRGADLVILAVPDAGLIPLSMRLLRPGGRTLLFAQTRLEDLVQIDAGAVCMQEKQLLGSYSSDITLQDEAADLIFARKIDVRQLVTHRLSLERIAEAIDCATTPGENSLKVVVTPDAAGAHAPI